MLTLSLVPNPTALRTQRESSGSPASPPAPPAIGRSLSGSSASPRSRSAQLGAGRISGRISSADRISSVESDYGPSEQERRAEEAAAEEALAQQPPPRRGEAWVEGEGAAAGVDWAALRELWLKAAALCREMHEAYLRTLAGQDAAVDDGAGLLRMCQFILIVQSHSSTQALTLTLTLTLALTLTPTLPLTLALALALTSCATSRTPSSRAGRVRSCRRRRWVRASRTAEG